MWIAFKARPAADQGKSAVGGPRSVLPQRRSVLCFSLNKAGKPLLTRVGSACFVYFCLSKAGQQLVDRVRRAPRGLSYLRCALAKAGQHLIDHIRRLPRSMFLFRFGLAKASQKLMDCIRCSLSNISVECGPPYPMLTSVRRLPSGISVLRIGACQLWAGQSRRPLC